MSKIQVTVEGQDPLTYLDNVRDIEKGSEARQAHRERLYLESTNLSNARTARRVACVTKARNHNVPVGKRGQPFSKNSKVTRIDIATLTMQGVTTMLPDLILEALKGSSPAKMFDSHMIKLELEKTMEKAPSTTNIRPVLMKMFRENKLNAYTVSDDKTVPYNPALSTRKMLVVLPENDVKLSEEAASENDLFNLYGVVPWAIITEQEKQDCRDGKLSVHQSSRVYRALVFEMLLKGRNGYVSPAIITKRFIKEDLGINPQRGKPNATTIRNPLYNWWKLKTVLARRVGGGEKKDFPPEVRKKYEYKLCPPTGTDLTRQHKKSPETVVEPQAVQERDIEQLSPAIQERTPDNIVEQPGELVTQEPVEQRAGIALETDRFLEVKALIDYCQINRVRRIKVQDIEIDF